jgi:hypothetical protein
MTVLGTADQFWSRCARRVTVDSTLKRRLPADGRQRQWGCLFPRRRNGMSHARRSSRAPITTSIDSLTNRLRERSQFNLQPTESDIKTDPIPIELVSKRETGASRASTTTPHGIDFSYRFGAAA